MTNTIDARAPFPLARLSKRTTWLVAAGFPLLYWVNGGVFPWARELFVDEHRAAWWPFWISVALLHLVLVAVSVRILHRHQLGVADVGLDRTGRQLVQLVGGLLAIGAVIVIARTWFGPLPLFDQTPFFRTAAPHGLGERSVWMFMAVLAGVCEEFIYRGMVLTTLIARGHRTSAAIALGAVSFALMHGPSGIIGFPFVGTLALAMSILRLRSDSLVPGIVGHALLDLSVILVA